MKIVFTNSSYEAKIGVFTFWGPVPDFDPVFRDGTGGFLAKNKAYQGQREFFGYLFWFGRY